MAEKTRKYENLLHEFDRTKVNVPQHKGKLIGGAFTNMESPNTTHSVSISLVYKPGIGWGDGEQLSVVGDGYYKLPHKHHSHYETFHWVGTDPDHPDDLGGTVEFWIGEGNDAEKYTITKPTTILMPPNIVHLPEYYPEVHHPFMSIVVYDAAFWAVDTEEVKVWPSTFEHYLNEQPYRR